MKPTTRTLLQITAQATATLLAFVATVAALMFPVIAALVTRG